MSTNLSQNTESQIREILERDVKPMVALHRGSIEFVSFNSGVVHVRLEGACKGCPLSQLTLKEGVEVLLKENVAGVDSVEAVV